MLLKRGMIGLFNIIFALCFCAVFMLSFSFPQLIKIYTHPFGISLSLLLFAIIVVMFYIAFYRFLSLLTSFWLRNITAFMVIIIVLLEIAIIVLFHTIMPPVEDGGHTYIEALYLLKHHHSSDNIYFQVYPNNIPITILRYWLYRFFSLVSVSNYMFIDKTTCAAVLSVCIFFSWKLVIKLFDLRMGIIFLLMTATCFPYFFYIIYFYTDTIALMFPVICLYFWYLYQQSKKIRYLLLLSAFLGIGCQIRPNLILFLPALAIYMCFILKFKKVMFNLMIILIAFLGINLSANAYYKHLGFTQNNMFKMPSTHWIMMGLSKNGGYNNYDYALTRVQPNQQAKKQADFSEIEKRIKEKKGPGLIYLWGVKTARTWAVGTRGYYWYAYISNTRTLIYEYLFSHQKQLMLFIIQIFHIVNIFFLMISVINFFRTRTINLNLFIQICLFGNFVFYVFLWEAEPRYILLFTPFMILGAVFGLEELMKIADLRRTGKTKVIVEIWSRIVLSICLLLSVLLCAILSYQEDTQTKIAYKQYSVNQFYQTGGATVTVNKQNSIEQTFKAQFAFNRILIGIQKKSGNGTYKFSISELGSNKKVFEKLVGTKNIKPRHYLTLSLKKSIPKKAKDYVITVRQVSGTPGSRLTFSLNGKGYEWRDLYTDGYFIRNTRALKNEDLQFKVYRLLYKPYISQKMYFTLFSIPVCMLLFYTIIYFVVSKRKMMRKS